MDEDEVFEEDFSDFDDYDWSDDGCGEGFSCSECDNYGCPAHPCN
jgi:hypothetical protein